MAFKHVKYADRVKTIENRADPEGIGAEEQSAGAMVPASAPKEKAKKTAAIQRPDGKKKVGRPKAAEQKKPLTVYLNEACYREILLRAGKERRNASEIARFAIEDYFGKS